MVLNMVEAGDVLQAGAAELKYEFYGMMLEGLEQSRGKQVGVGHEHRWLSDGYTEAAANELGMADSQVLRRGVRLMRLDVVVEDVFNPEAREAVLPVFRLAAGNFLRDYADPMVNFPSQISPAAAKINAEWDGSISNFYGLLYQRSPRSIGAFLLYEIEVLQAYASWQNQRGGPLSAVDCFSLKRLVGEGRATNRLLRQLGRVSQIKLDRNVNTLHRSLLLSRWKRA